MEPLTSPPARTNLTDALRRNRRWLLVSGVLALIAGAVAIAIPAAASVTIEIFVGWLLIASSAVLTVDALGARPRSSYSSVVPPVVRPPSRRARQAGRWRSLRLAHAGAGEGGVRPDG